MSSPAVLSDAARDALAALAASPLAAELAAKVDGERAARRCEVIEAMHRDAAAAKAEAEAMGNAALAQRDDVARRRADYLAALGRQRELEGAASAATHQAERAVLRADRDLAELGGDRLDAALYLVRVAARQSQALIDHRVTRDHYGNVADVREADPSHSARWRRMTALAAELEAMRYDPAVTPAAIEARCREALAEVDRTVPAPLPDAARAHPVLPALR